MVFDGKESNSARGGCNLQRRMERSGRGLGFGKAKREIKEDRLFLVSTDTEIESGAREERTVYMK